MEPNFQTSFIPKRPMIEERAAHPQSASLLLIVAIFIFLAVIIASAGLFFYKGILSKNLAQMEADLKLAKESFEPSKIVQLEQLDRRLSASQEILSKHVAISPIFEILEKITLKTIQYTEFGYEWGDGGTTQRIQVSMKGKARGYRSIALQSDLFTKNEQMIDPVFSDLALDEDGSVMFDLKFSMDPSTLNYKNLVTQSLNEQPTEVEAALTEEPIDLSN